MKDLKISKELLSEVLKLEVVKHSLFNKSNNSFNITYMPSEDSLKSSWMPINIYEFAFKCKEWAKNKEYIVHSSPTQKIEHTAIIQSFDINKFYYGENQFYALTEVEAIIQACEWLLEYKENQCTK